MRSKRVVFVALVLATLMSVAVPPSRADVSFEGFFSDLGPHGSWLVSAQFGRVWQPREYRPGWHPYYDGHWEYADVGWTWVSDYSWGAIPYHYGTWTLDPSLGWVWIPGYTWAPAWVEFRTGPDYTGWAPVAPSFSFGLSFGGYAAPSAPFLFVPTRDFAAPRIRSHVVRQPDAGRIAHDTRPVGNLVLQHDIVINRGPDVRVIEAASRHEIAVVPVETVPRVAPFHAVRRSQLAIAPEQARYAVRAAEPMRTREIAPSLRGSSHEQNHGPAVPKKPSGDRGRPNDERRTS